MKYPFTVLSSLCMASTLFAQAPAGTGVAEPPLLEFRMLASDDYEAGDVSFDLGKEKVRLRAWLAVADRRERVLADPRRVHDFNALDAERGGSLSPHLEWYPHVIRPGAENAKQWQLSFVELGDEFHVVPLFAPEQYAAAPRDGDARLVELVAVNMHAQSFSAGDLDPSSVRAGTDPASGMPSITYGIAADKKDAYADWSAKHTGEPCAILIRGELRSAPVFQGRITGSGRIIGSFSEQEAADLARDIAAAAEPADALPETTVAAGDAGGPVPAGADPADIAAMQGAQAMLEAEKRLRDMIKAGKITGIDKILTFDEISSWPYEDGLLGMPERVKKLDGANVLMTGFMLPIDEVENIQEFLLVQSLWSCCYGQPPDINGIVRVVMKGDARIDYQFDPIKVTGTFQVEATLEDGYCVDIYQLEADSVEVIR